MTILHVLRYPNPHLREKTIPVTNIKDLSTQQLIDDMIETMYDHNGVGLAANQVGSDLSIITCDDSGEQTNPQVLINPEIIGRAKGIQKSTEGCLCIPGIFVPIKRFDGITVEWRDRNGEIDEILAENELANILQHEIDHLHGVLFIDHISKMQRKIYRKRLKGIKF